MRYNAARYERSVWCEKFEARRRLRLRPTLLALEDRRLLSTFTVNNPTDTPVAGEIDLRQAVGLANAAGGANTIDFDGTVFNAPQTITLTGTQLELTTANEAVTIRGPAVGVNISGGGVSRVFQIDKLVTASLSGLTISDGNTGSYAQGGGVLNLGTATLYRCTVTGNVADGSIFGGRGGGVANGNDSYAPDATLTMTSCNLIGNSAYSGGGLYNGGKATLTGCTISGNSALGTFGHGGGVYAGSIENSTAVTTLTNCFLSSNQASGYIGFGGGVANYATTTLSNCIVSGNSAGGEGGGLSSSASPYGGQASELTLTNCTVSANSAGNGGAVATQAGFATTPGGVLTQKRADDLDQLHRQR